MAQRQTAVDDWVDVPHVADGDWVDVKADNLDAVRENQAKKFPTRAESGEDIPETKPVGDMFRAEAAVVNPTLLFHKEYREPFTRMAGTVASDVAGMASVPINALLHPWDTAKAIAGTMTGSPLPAREASETKVGKAWQEGDYPYAITRGILNMVPFGPGIGEMLDESGVDPAKLPGHVAGQAIAPEVVKGMGRVASGTVNLARDIGTKGVKAAAVDAMSGRLTPTKQYFKAMRPMNSKINFEPDAEVAMPELKQAAKKAGFEIKDIQTLDDAHELAIDDLIGKQKALMGDKDIVVNGKSVADKIKGAVPKLFRRENPEAAAGIDEWADKVYDQDFTHFDLNEMRKDANAANVGYHGKLPTGQMALDRTLDAAIKKAKADGIRELQYKTMEQQAGTGGQMRDVNQRLKALLTSQDVLDRRYNVEMRQAMQNLPQQVSKLIALGKFGQAAKSLVTGDVGGAAIHAFTGLGEAALANFLKEANSTSGQIASSFRRLTREPTPIKGSPMTTYRRGIGPANSIRNPVTEVIPSTETGAGTPNHPLAGQGWNRPTAMAVGDETRSVADLKAYLEQEGAAGRTGVMSQRPVEEPAIDVSYAVRPMAHGQPASTLSEQRLLPSGSGQVPGRTPFEMPESPLGAQDFARGSLAKSEIVRDPKTGRFKKVYSSDRKEVKK